LVETKLFLNLNQCYHILQTIRHAFYPWKVQYEIIPHHMVSVCLNCD